VQQNIILPFFSIIIPTKDRCDLLMDALQSVLNQTYLDFEVIVIDDDSQDDTLMKLNTVSDERLLIVKNKSTERSAARNTGIDIAKGRYICFLDDDDMYEVNYLKDFHNELEKLNYPTDTILRTGFYKLKEDGSKKKAVLYNEINHTNAVRFAAYNMCGAWTLCIPRQCLEQERFDERFPHWQDTHLILRLFGKYKFHQMETFNYCYRIHQKMGSQMLNNGMELRSKALINVLAIKDFFKNNISIQDKFLLKETLPFLTSEKYAQYAVRAVKTDRAIGSELMRESKAAGIFRKLWKYYLLYFYNFLKSV
jgi:glycosyltransferase involved in cell wall biosynthesis